MYKIPAANRLGLTLPEALPDLYPELEPHLRRALAGQAVTGVKFCRPRLDLPAEFYTFLASFQPARDEAGEVIAISVVIVDITERKQAEDALRESEDRYRQMLQLNSQIPWTINANGLAIEVSPQWEQITVMDAEQTCNNSWLAALHFEDVTRIVPEILHCLRTGDPIHIEHRICDKNGGGCAPAERRGAARMARSSVGTGAVRTSTTTRMLCKHCGSVKRSCEPSRQAGLPAFRVMSMPNP